MGRGAFLFSALIALTFILPASLHAQSDARPKVYVTKPSDRGSVVRRKSPHKPLVGDFWRPGDLRRPRKAQ
jgi:hypothetical protein